MLKFTITNTDGNDFEVDEPFGFDGVKLRLLRHNEWHGFFNFIDDGAIALEFENNPKNNSYAYDLLKNEFDSYGLMSKATLKIEFKCSDTDGYDVLFTGRFDFNKYAEYCGDTCYCSISVEEESCLMDFKNRYDQKVDLNDKFSFDKVCDDTVLTVVKLCFITAPNVLSMTTSSDLDALNVGDSPNLAFLGFPANDGANKIINIELNKYNLGQDYYYFETPFTTTGVNDFVTFSGVCLKLYELYNMPSLDRIVEFTPKPLVYKDIWGNPANTPQTFQDEKLYNEVVGTTAVFFVPIEFQDDTLTEIIDSNRTPLPYYQIPIPALSNSVRFANDDGEIVNLKKDSKLNCSHEITVNLRLKGDFTLISGETANYGLFLELRWGDFIDQLTPLSFRQQILSLVAPAIWSAGSTRSGSFDVTFSHTFTLDPYKEYPQKIYLNWEMPCSYLAGPPTPSNALKLDLDYEICDLEITQTSICENTYPKVYLINEVFGRITEKYTNECLKTFSRFFGRYDSLPYPHELPTDPQTLTWGCGGLLSLTNGLKIRDAKNNDGSEYALKVSMKDVFEAMKSVYNIGMGVEYDEFRNDGSKLIRIEPYKYFYNDAVVFTAEYVDKVQKRVNTNKYVSLVDVGYSTWTTENTNGLNDVFTSRNYRTELSTVKNTYKAICDFIASDYAIEITRRKWGSITNDWRYDNNTFIAMLEPEYGIGLKTETFDFPPNDAQNINFAEYCYNLRITPARNLLRHISTIFSSYKDMVGKSIIFLDGQGNYVARIDITSENCLDENKGITENIRVTLNDFSDTDFPLPIFSNESVIFEYPLAYEDWKTIMLNPYGLVEYSCADGVLKYGWIEDLKYNPTTFMGEFILKEKL